MHIDKMFKINIKISKSSKISSEYSVMIYPEKSHYNMSQNLSLKFIYLVGFFFYNANNQNIIYTIIEN